MSSNEQKQYILWKYNRTTGYWKVVRNCSEDTMEQWHRIFSTDEPAEYFYLTAGKKPSFNPIPKQI